MIPTGLHAIRSNKLPELVDAEIALFKRAELPKAAEMLAEYITNHLENNAQ